MGENVLPATWTAGASGSFAALVPAAALAGSIMVYYRTGSPSSVDALL